MGSLALAQVELRGGLRVAAACGDAHQGACEQGRVNERIVISPGQTANVRVGTRPQQGANPAAHEFHDPKFSRREKGDAPAIWRPRGEARVVGVIQRPHPDRIERAQPEASLAHGVACRECQGSAVGREGKVAEKPDLFRQSDLESRGLGARHRRVHGWFRDEQDRNRRTHGGAERGQQRDLRGAQSSTAFSAWDSHAGSGLAGAQGGRVVEGDAGIGDVVQAPSGVALQAAPQEDANPHYS